MKIRVIVMLVTSLFKGASAACAGTIAMSWTTDQEPVAYQPGETMRLMIQLLEDGQPLAGKTLKWRRTGDDGAIATGQAVSSATQPVEVTTSASQPGFVKIEVEVFNPDDSAMKGANGEALKFEGGAGSQPEKLAGTPEPADFDAFWEQQKARLAEVPMTAELKEIAEARPGFRIYDVKVACAGKRPMTAYLAVPDGAKEKSLAAQVIFHGYGVSGAAIQTAPGRIVLDVGAHGLENGREDAYYKTLEEGELKGYGLNNEENAKPETAYFNGMLLRVMRALQYVKSRPEWNGRELIVTGPSQGGFQAIAAAALDADVTRCEALKPWCCDLSGIKQGRLRGWRPDDADGLAYYDTATLGKRIQCETSLLTALGDYVCPPSGVMLLYYNLKSTNKMIEIKQGETHGWDSAPNSRNQILRHP
jgi:cephalosporin-C deacetylase